MRHNVERVGQTLAGDKAHHVAAAGVEPLRRWTIAALLCLLSACAPKQPAPLPQIAVEFRGLWFSVEERRLIDAGALDVSPTLDTPLLKWNATYATATAHPDIVNAQIRISSPPGAARQAVVVAMREEWRIGTADPDAPAVWAERSNRVSQLIDLVPGKTIGIALPIAARQMIRRLTAEGRVPWRLAVRVDLRDAAQRHTLAMSRATLPVIVESLEPELERALHWQTADSPQGTRASEP